MNGKPGPEKFNIIVSLYIPYRLDNDRVLDRVVMAEGSRKVRASYTLQFKMGVVEWVESTGASLRAAARKFSVDRKMIRSWIGSKERMKSALLARGPGMRKLHEGRSPISEELDKLVSGQYISELNDGKTLSNKEIKECALKFAGLLGLSEFKATSSWVTRWRGRCGIEPERDGFGIKLENETVATLLHIASTLLSQVRPSEVVNLSCRQMNQSVPSIVSPDLPLENVYIDYSTPEHNYCKPSTAMSNDNDDTVMSKQLSLDTLMDCHIMTGAGDSPMYDLTHESFTEPTLECEVAEMDLPYSAEIEILQDIFTKVKGGSDLNARSTSPPFFPHLTFDLDDPQSHGGLLASRMLQPVFPDEPEIVYLDMQLGMLHSIH